MLNTNKKSNLKSEIPPVPISSGIITSGKKAILISAAAITMIVSSCSSPAPTDGSQDAKIQSADSAQNFSFDTATLAAGTTYYQCPMDLEQISDKPGSCPKCGMDLQQMTKK